MLKHYVLLHFTIISYDGFKYIDRGFLYGIKRMKKLGSYLIISYCSTYLFFHFFFHDTHVNVYHENPVLWIAGMTK